LRLFHVKQRTNNSTTHFISPFHVEHLPVTVTGGAVTDRIPTRTSRRGAPRGTSCRHQITGPSGSAACPLAETSSTTGGKGGRGATHVGGAWGRLPRRGDNRRLLSLRLTGGITPVLLLPAPTLGEPGRSEQWLLGRNPVAPREAVGAQLSLAQDAVFESLMDHVGRLQAELAQRLRWPAGGAAVLTVRKGRLRHQHPAVDFQERGGTLGQHSRPAEGAGQDPVEARPRSRLSSAHLGALLQDRDSALEAQALHGPAEKGSPAAVGLQERHGDLGPVRGHDQTRQAASRTEIYQACAVMPGTVLRQAAGDGGKPLGVADLRIEGAGPEEAKNASLRQELT
jgi:hypothetical protein